MTHKAITLATQLQQNPDLLQTTNTHVGQQALCVHIGGDLWYQDTGQPAQTAINICRKCPTQTPCLAIALATNETHGIWGATTPTNRRPLRRQLRLTSPT